MARPVITFRSSVYSTTNASPYTAAPTWTPAANSGIIALVATAFASSPTDPTGVTGHGLTYTKLAAGSQTLSTTHAISVWYADAGSSPTSVACVATVAGSPVGGVISEFEITGHVAAGILAAIADVATANATATSGSVTVPLCAEATEQNGWLSFFVHLANEASTGQGGNWTNGNGATPNFNTPATGAWSQSNVTGYTSTATASWTTSSAYRGLAITIAGSASVLPSESLKIVDTVTVALDPEFALPTAESLKIGESLTTSRETYVSAGTENVKIADTVTVVLDLGVLPSESIRIIDPSQGLTQLIGVVKISDTISVLMILNAAVSGESLKVAESLSAMNSDLVASVTESLKLADTQTVTLDPIHAQPAEALLIADSLTVVLDLGVLPTESIRIIESTDGPTLDPLQTSQAENARIVESLPAAPQLDPLLATAAAENIKLADGPPVAGMPIEALVAQESLRIVESSGGGQPTLNPLQATPAESARIIESTPNAPAIDPEAVTVAAENLKLADTVTAARDLTASPSESVRVVESSGGNSPALSPLLPFADPSETLKLADQAVLTDIDRAVLVAQEGVRLVESSGNVAPYLDPIRASAPTEALKIAEELSAERVVDISVTVAAESVRLVETSGGQAPRLDPIQVAPADGLNVVDTVSAVLGGSTLLASPSESLRLSDRVVILDVTLTETMRLVDVGQGRTSLIGTLRISDTITVNLSNFLLAAASESLRISEARTVQREPFEAVLQETLKIGWTASEAELTRDEYLSIGEVIATSLLGPTDLSTLVAQENLRLADTALASRDIQAQAATENLKLADAASMLRDVEATPSEALRLTDAVGALSDLAVAVTAEALRGADTAATLLDHEEATPSESVRVLDAATVSLALPGDLVTAVADATVRLADALSVSRDLDVVATESVGIGEVLDAGFGQPLDAPLTDEALTVADVTSSSRLGTLETAPSEVLRLSDAVAATRALVVVVAHEAVVSYDNDLLRTAMDLSAEIPGPDVEPIDVIAITNEALSTGMFSGEAFTDAGFSDESLEPA